MERRRAKAAPKRISGKDEEFQKENNHNKLLPNVAAKELMTETVRDSQSEGTTHSPMERGKPPTTSKGIDPITSMEDVVSGGEDEQLVDAVPSSDNNGDTPRVVVGEILYQSPRQQLLGQPE